MIFSFWAWILIKINCILNLFYTHSWRLFIFYFQENIFISSSTTNNIFQLLKKKSKKFNIHLYLVIKSFMDNVWKKLMLKIYIKHPSNIHCRVEQLPVIQLSTYKIKHRNVIVITALLKRLSKHFAPVFFICIPCYLCILYQIRTYSIHQLLFIYFSIW